MNLSTAGIPSVLAASLFASVALGADGTPAVTTATAQAASASPATQNAPAQAAPALATSTAGGSGSGVRKLVCLNMSLQCFTVKPPGGESKSAHTRPLDLRAPDIRILVSEAELRQRLDEPYELREMQEQVQVEGTRPDLYLPIGIASLPWAVMHPTQAWRIFLPIPPAQAK